MSKASLRKITAQALPRACAAMLSAGAFAPAAALAQDASDAAGAVVAPDARPEALRCLTEAVYYEAATEPRAGQEAVAQVVLNRLRRTGFPKTVCGVVYEGSERSTGCQFTFTCDGSLGRRPVGRLWDAAASVAAAALDGYVAPQAGDATHYHAAWMTPVWAKEMIPVGRIGAHIFYRLSDHRTLLAAADDHGRPPHPAELRPAPSAADFDVWGLKVATLSKGRGGLVVATGVEPMAGE